MKKNNDNETLHPNSRSSLLKSGCIGAFYTLTGYFVKIKPAYKIDKIVFSFVQKGKSGDGFNIYVDTDKFDLLCDSILSKELFGLLAQSNQEKPAWKYITGHGGSKMITIFSGTNGIVIHGYDKKKGNANVPVTYTDLQITAKWHRRVFSKYSEKLVHLCISAMENNAKYFNAKNQDIPLSTTVGNPKNIGYGSPKNNANEVFTKIKTSTVIREYGSYKNLCFMGYTQHNKELVFIVTPENSSRFDQAIWKAFYNAAKKKTDILVNIGYVQCKDKLLVTSIAS